MLLCCAAHVTLVTSTISC